MKDLYSHHPTSLIFNPPPLPSDRCFVLPLLPSDDRLGLSSLFHRSSLFSLSPLPLDQCLYPLRSSNILPTNSLGLFSFEFSIKVGSDPNLILQSRWLADASLIYLVSRRCRPSRLHSAPRSAVCFTIATSLVLHRAMIKHLNLLKIRTSYICIIVR